MSRNRDCDGETTAVTNLMWLSLGSVSAQSRLWILSVRRWLSFTNMALLSLLLHLTILCFAFTKVSFGSLHFLRGRPRGGMLVAPESDSKTNVKDLPEAHWFTQRLDHFDDSNTKTWQQRYFYNDSFHVNSDGPVFLMIGGEGEANPIWLTVGDMMENAQVFGAFTFLLEHRFYGQSRPTR